MVDAKTGIATLSPFTLSDRNYLCGICSFLSAADWKSGLVQDFKECSLFKYEAARCGLLNIKTGVLPPANSEHGAFELPLTLSSRLCVV